MLALKGLGMTGEEHNQPASFLKSGEGGGPLQALELEVGEQERLARSLALSLNSKRFAEFKRELGLIQSRIGADASAWTSFIGALWGEAAKTGYTVRTYVGRRDIVTVSRLGSLLMIAFFFPETVGDDDTKASEGVAAKVFELGRAEAVDVDPASAFDDWRSRQDLRYLVVDEIGKQLALCRGKILRRFGDRGLDKHRLASAFEFAAGNGFHAMDGRLVKGEAFLDALVSDVNRLSVTDVEPYCLSACAVAGDGCTVLVEIDMGGHAYRFKMNLPSLRLQAQEDASARKTLISKSLVPGNSRPLNIPAVSKRHDMAGHLLDKQSFVLPDVLFSSAVHQKSEPVYAQEVVIDDKTFADIQGMLNREDGRAQARQLIEAALNLPPGSATEELLRAARERAKEDSRFVSLAAIVRALI